MSRSKLFYFKSLNYFKKNKGTAAVFITAVGHVMLLGTVPELLVHISADLSGS